MPLFFLTEPALCIFPPPPGLRRPTRASSLAAPPSVRPESASRGASGPLVRMQASGEDLATTTCVDLDLPRVVHAP